jgi:hypothetical protein
MIFLMYALTWSSAVTVRVRERLTVELAGHVPIMVKPYFFTLNVVSGRLAL